MVILEIEKKRLLKEEKEREKKKAQKKAEKLLRRQVHEARLKAIQEGLVHEEKGEVYYLIIPPEGTILFKKY